MERIPELREIRPTSEVRIDIATLREFGTFIRSELSGSIAPMAARVAESLSLGGDPVPDLPSEDLQEMNVRHADCVLAMKQQLAAFEIGLAILADSAEVIATSYSSSDLLAYTKIRDIASAINAATLQDTPRGGLE